MFGEAKGRSVILTRSICKILLGSNSLSMVTGISFLLVKGGHLSRSSFISCFQKEKEKSECPFSICCFSGTFSSKWSLCPSGILWNGIFSHLLFVFALPHPYSREKYQENATRTIKTFSSLVEFHTPLLRIYSAGSRGKKINKVQFVLFSFCLEEL